MANKKITDLPDSDPLSTTSPFETVQGADSVKATAAQIFDYIQQRYSEGLLEDVLIRDQSNSQLFFDTDGLNSALTFVGEAVISATQILAVTSENLTLDGNTTAVLKSGAAEITVASGGSGEVVVTTGNIIVNGLLGYSGDVTVMTSGVPTFVTMTFTNGILTGVT